MNGTLNLKVFFSISLGLHLLFLSIASILSLDFKIERLPILNIEVSLLPLIPEEIQLKAQVKKEGKETLQNEKKEEPVQKRELEPKSPYSIQTVETNILIEEPKPLSHENEKKETRNEKEPVVQAMNISPQSDLILTLEKENLSTAMIQSKVSHGNPHPNPTPSVELQNLVKIQPSTGGEILVTQPKYAENPKPLYPQEARKKGYEGEVILRVEVLSNGRVGQVEVRKSSGYELLDRSALTTVKQWRFVPAKKGEVPVPLWVNIPVKFQLQ
jgi:protein TonB